MSAIIERRPHFWTSALTMAMLFGSAVIVAITLGKVPVIQQPWLIARTDNPSMYYAMTTSYAFITVSALFLAFFRLPWVRLGQIRLGFAVLFLLLFAFLIYELYLAQQGAAVKPPALPN